MATIQADHSGLDSASSAPSSADDADHSHIASAISSASSQVSTATSHAAQAVGESAESARESVVEGVQAAAAAAGFAGSRSGGRQADFGVPLRERMTEDIPPNKKLFVGNVQFSLTENDLVQAFAKHGDVVSCRIAYDPRGASKG